MKKIIIILLFLCVFTLNYAYEDFLADKRVTLTPEEKEEYYRRVKEDPENYSFNPLHLGDSWYYSIHFYGENTINGIYKVTDNRMIDNKRLYQYSVFHTNGHPPYNIGWKTNIGDTTLVWDSLNCIDETANDFLVDEDFSINADSGTNYENPISIFHSGDNSFTWDRDFKCYYLGGGFINLWGVVTEYKIIQYYSVVVADLIHIIYWARGFGKIYNENEWSSTNLLGCIINNVSYGDTSALSNESPVVTIKEIEVTNYPNPFRSNTQISYQLPKNTNQGCLEIYNVKGQIIKKENIINNGTFNWDAKDQQGNAVASGIYFINIKTDKSSAVKKILLIK